MISKIRVVGRLVLEDMKHNLLKTRRQDVKDAVIYSVAHVFLTAVLLSGVSYVLAFAQQWASGDEYFDIGQTITLNSPFTPLPLDVRVFFSDVFGILNAISVMWAIFAPAALLKGMPLGGIRLAQLLLLPLLIAIGHAHYTHYVVANMNMAYGYVALFATMYLVALAGYCHRVYIDGLPAEDDG